MLDLYEAAPELGRPRLCFDERPCQLIGQIVAPLPMQPGRVKREDNEYQRNGTAVVLLAYDLDRGRRYLDVRKHRKKADYADFMYHLILLCQIRNHLKSYGYVLKAQFCTLFRRNRW